MRPPVQLVGIQLGSFTVTARSLIGRGSDGTFMWKLRCSVCGTERACSGNYIQNLTNAGKGLPCRVCHPAKEPPRRCRRRCWRCGRSGHSADECTPRVAVKRICDRCGSLPHRVTGKRCATCGLRYEAEPREGIDYDARNPSALARLMGGGG